MSADRLERILILWNIAEEEEDKHRAMELEVMAIEELYEIYDRDEEEHKFETEMLESLIEREWHKIQCGRDPTCHINSFFRRVTYGDHSQVCVFTIDDKLIMKNNLRPQPCGVKHKKRKI
jgi:hypothetical protein